MNDEPHGHRGHPFDREARRAAKLRVYVERALVRLERQGFSPPEAIAFLAALAYDRADRQGETWANPYNAIGTVERILEGRGAKEWSMDALVLALYDIGELTS